MHYLDKRIKNICEHLNKQMVVKSRPLSGWEYKEGNYLRPEDADKSQMPYLPFDSMKMLWYGPDKHYWFRTTLEIPQDMDGKTLWLRIRTQISEWDDGKNPQFLLFLNGNVIQGVDMNHREVLLCRSAKAGETYRVDLQAYTGTLHSEFNLLVNLEETDPEVEGLYWDLIVPLRAFDRLDPQSRSRMELERVLNDAVNLLDLRTPYRREYLNGGPSMPENMPVVEADEAYHHSVKAAREYLKKHLYEELAGRDEVIASCIGHTHIDVAWWWTVAQTEEKVCRSFATVLKLMEEYPHYKFMSSQPQLYAFLKARYPEVYDKIKARIKEGRWEPEGSTWVEMDCNITSGESLVRQFLHGKKFFRDEFGVENKILWLPDVFGYSGALPQIMKECGVDYFMTTKLAWNQFNQHPYDTFIWRGIDGSEVLTHLITTLGVGQDVKNFFTTYNGDLHPDAIIGGWQRYQNKDINNDILISYGYGDGGGGPTRGMLETSDRMEKGVMGLPMVRQCTARQYFDELNERVKGNRRLPTWEGELYFEYHRGTYTSVARNKRSNRKAEFHLMDLELISALAAGKTVYPAKELDAMWKKVLINQFHDILPGSSIHEVYEVTKKEYEELEEKIAALQKERISLLAAPSENVTVFNTKGFAMDEVVYLPGMQAAALKDGAGNLYPVQQVQGGVIVSLSELPAKGWRTYQPVQESEKVDLPFRIKDERHIITPFYEVSLDECGRLDRLYAIRMEREILQPGAKGNLLRVYEDKPIYYDNWDIDEYYTEKYYDVTDVSSMKWTEAGPVRATLEIEWKYSRSVIRQKIHFYADNARIDFETWVDWHEHQSLLKAHFPVDVHTDEATFDIQFGNLKRKTHKNTSWDQARFESCGQKWMDLSEGHFGVSLLNDCKYGHSVHNSNIGLTLIKSGIEPNPLTDQEEHNFTYALYPHEEDWRWAGTVEEAYALNQPALAVMGGDAGSEFSLASVNSDHVVIETIKQAEDGDGWIVRLYECDNARAKVELTWGWPIQRAEECNAIEEKKADAEISGEDKNVLSFIIKPFEIKTFRIR